LDVTQIRSDLVEVVNGGALLVLESGGDGLLVVRERAAVSFF
jgi:hypothetical protein